MRKPSACTQAQPGPWPALGGVLSLLLLVGMPSSASGPPTDTAGPAADKALQRIHQLIGKASCSADAQCRLAALGWRSCGGAESFAAWSVKSTNEPELQKWLTEYAGQRQRWQEKLGIASTCELLPEPGVRCGRAAQQPARCVLVPQASGIR